MRSKQDKVEMRMDALKRLQAETTFKLGALLWAIPTASSKENCETTW
jgi:hypothetical protein